MLTKNQLLKLSRQAEYKLIQQVMKQSRKEDLQLLKDLITLKYAYTLEQFSSKDSGKFGKAFEVNVKQFLNGNKGNSKNVTSKGKKDVKYKGLTYEIKSNCGELNNIEKNDYIIYSMDNIRDYDKPWNARVISPVEFLNMLNKIGLIRESKKATNGTWHKAIQSYKNSKRKYAMLTEALEQFPTLLEWIIK